MVPTSVTFEAGQSTATFTITGKDDSIADGAQTVEIRTIGLSVPASATVIVTDDDVAPQCTRPVVDGEIWFHTTDEDLDFDTRIWASINSGSVTRLGSYAQGGPLADFVVSQGPFDDDSTHGPYVLAPSPHDGDAYERLNICQEKLVDANISFYIQAEGIRVSCTYWTWPFCGTRDGHDEWHFDFTLRLTYQDGSSARGTYRGIRLNSTGPNNRYVLLRDIDLVAVGRGPGLGIRFTPNVAGVWYSNIGLTFDITQNEDEFTWTIRERELPGWGALSTELTGWKTDVSVNWTDLGFVSNTHGRVLVSGDPPDGRVLGLFLDNGLWLARLPMEYDPNVIVLIPDLRGAWSSNIGLTFDISQTGKRYSWTVREREMPGEGHIDDRRISAIWADFGTTFNATGTISVDRRGVGTRITLSNEVVFTRP